MNIIFKT